MIKYIILYSFIFSNIGIIAEEIVGLDSLKIHDQASITILKKDAYNAPLDTLNATIRIIERRDKEVPDILITYSNESDVVRLVSGDTIYVLNIANNSFRNYYSTELSSGRETSIYYHYLYLKRNVHYYFTTANKEVEINSKTSIKPSDEIIKYESQIDNIENGITSIHKLTIFTNNYDSLEYKAHVLKDNDTINQLSVNYIFSKNIDTNKLNIINKVYNDWKTNKFKLEQKEKNIPQKKSELIGKTLKTEYNFEGLNREDINLNEELSKNKFSIIYTWGTWCGPCMMNKDNITEFVSKSEIPFYSIMFEFDNNPIKKMTKYIKINNPSYPIYRSDSFIRDNELMHFPAFLLVNSTGVILDAFDGKAENYKDYIELLNRNIKKN